MEIDQQIEQIISVAPTKASNLEDARQWIEDRLCGRDQNLMPDAGSGESKYELFWKLSSNEKVEELIKENIWYATLSLIGDLCSGDQKFRDEPDFGVNLLLMTSELARKSKTRDELLQLQHDLNRFVRDPRNENAARLELKEYALHLLVELKTYAVPDFWISHYSRPESTSLIFEALTQFHPERAFEWLATLDECDEVGDAFYDLLPTLLEKFGRVEIERFFVKYLLSEKALSCENFKRIWIEEGFDLPVDVSVDEPVLAEVRAGKSDQDDQNWWVEVDNKAKNLSGTNSERLKQAQVLASQYVPQTQSLDPFLSQLRRQSNLKENFWIKFSLDSPESRNQILGDVGFWYTYSQVSFLERPNLRVNVTALLIEDKNKKKVFGNVFSSLAKLLQKTSENKRTQTHTNPS